MCSVPFAYHLITGVGSPFAAHVISNGLLVYALSVSPGELVMLGGSKSVNKRTSMMTAANLIKSTI